MPITFYNECEALQIPSGTNGADGLSAVSAVKDSTTTIPASGSTTTLFASAVGTFGYEWLKAGVFFNMPGYGTYEVTSEGAATATEKQITYRNNGTAGNVPTTVVPTGTLIVPAGPPGSNGTNGATVLNGALAPTSGQGNNGDFFINTATSTIYGPKAAGAWPAGVSLVGAAGPTGASGSTLLPLTPANATAKAALIQTTLTLLNTSYNQVFPAVNGFNIPAVDMALYNKVKIIYTGYIFNNNSLGLGKLDSCNIGHFIDFVPGAATATSLSTRGAAYTSTNTGSIYESSLQYSTVAGDLVSEQDFRFEIDIVRLDDTGAEDNYGVSVFFSVAGWGIPASGTTATRYLTIPKSVGWASDALRVQPYIFINKLGNTSAVIRTVCRGTIELYKV